MTETLTPRQREVLALALELTDERRVARTLGMAYQTLENHVNAIKATLGLETRFVEFKGLPIGARFRHGGIVHQKVPHATDQFGGYNAQGEDGKRRLFRRDEIVEVNCE